MNRLPEEADAPQIQKTDSGSDPVLFIIISSNKRSSLELTDYAERYLVDRISSVPGVANIFLNGGRRYAMRIWLDRGALAARQVAVTDIENALRTENVELPAGRIESQQREFTLRTDTSLRTEEDFRNLVIGRGADGYLVRLGEVATVQLAAENQRSGAATNDGPAILMPVVALSTANVLEVAAAVKKEMALIREGAAQGHQHRGEHRQLGVHPGVDEEGVAGAGRDAGHRAGGDLPVPGQRARDADSGRHHPGLASSPLPW